MNHFSKGGVYDTRKTGEAFRGAEDRHVAPISNLSRDHVTLRQESQRRQSAILPASILSFFFFAAAIARSIRGVSYLTFSACGSRWS
jgi:hypothetical protein